MNNQQQNMASLAHASTYAGFLIPGGNFIVPAVILITHKDDDFVVEHAKEAVNFQISMLLLLAVLSFFSLGLIGIPFWLAALGFSVVMPVVGALAVARGDQFRYPLTLRLIQ